MSLNNTTSKVKDQNTHLRTAGVVQACHNFLISQTGLQQPGFWITMVGFGIPFSWILDSKAVDSGFHRPKLPGFQITLLGAIIKTYGSHLPEKNLLLNESLTTLVPEAFF